MSIAATGNHLADSSGILHRRGVWFQEDVREMTIFSEQYDFVISLLVLENQVPDIFSLSQMLRLIPTTTL